MKTNRIIENILLINVILFICLVCVALVGSFSLLKQGAEGSKPFTILLIWILMITGGLVSYWFHYRGVVDKMRMEKTEQEEEVEINAIKSN